MSTLSRLTWVGLAALALAGCGRETPTNLACTPSIERGIWVTVVDSLTGAAPSSEATLIARSGEYVDSAGPVTPLPGSMLLLTAVDERPGSYDLTVRSPGYAAWTRNGVQVTADRCHVRRVDVTARLRK